MNIEIEVNHSELSQTIYRFWITERLLVVLDSISHFERQTKRHKFVSNKHWMRLSRRDSTIERENPPESVKEQAKQKLIEMIKFEG